MLTFRPHHFMCTLGFVGEGYSSDFIKNYATIVKRIINNENIPIKVIFGTDSICAACPEKLARDLCLSQKKVNSLDKIHANILDFKDGEVLTWKLAKKRILKKMTYKNFHHACKGCSWKNLGVCEIGLRNLKTQG